MEDKFDIKRWVINEDLQREPSNQFDEVTMDDLENMRYRLEDKKVDFIMDVDFTSQPNSPNIITIQYREKMPYGQAGGEWVNVRFQEDEKQQVVDHVGKYLEKKFGYALELDENLNEEEQSNVEPSSELKDIERGIKSQFGDSVSIEYDINSKKAGPRSYEKNHPVLWVNRGDSENEMKITIGGDYGSEYGFIVWRKGGYKSFKSWDEKGIVDNVINWLDRNGEEGLNEEDFGGIYAGIDFPIKDMIGLDSFYKINYLKLAGEQENRDLASIAQGETSADSEEEEFAMDIINLMRQGKLTDPTTSEQLLDDLTQEYYG